MSRSTCPLDCKVYVGELGSNGDRRELEDAFGRYGPLRNVWVARNPPGFAFVEFENARDAEDAVKDLDGRTVCGRRVRVELSSGRSREKKFGGGRGGGRDNYDRRDNRRDDRDRGRDSDRDYRRRSRSRDRGERDRSRSRDRGDRDNGKKRDRSATPDDRGKERDVERNGSAEREQE